jgi:hypothetical protein
MLLGIAVNAVAGVLVIIIFLGMGFSGAGLHASLFGVFVCCLIGFALSFVFSSGRPGHIWVYGLAYVAFSLLFVYSSGFGASTGETRLLWTALLAVIYGVSLAGGILGGRKGLVLPIA